MVMPYIFATQPAGNVPASYLDTNLTFLEAQGVQALTTTGSANAYSAAPSDAWVTGYSSYAGRALTIIPNFSNTGSATVNVSGLGAITLYKNVSGVATALTSGDMTANIPAIIICDGTNFWLTNPTSSSGVKTVKSQVFPGTGTYTPSTGMLYCELWGIGAGGGGGGVAAVAGAGGGGGAAGSEAKLIASAATIGASQPVTIGAGGTAGANTGGTGGTGGTTSVGALITCPGGLGGGGGANVTSIVGGAGQAASGGNFNGTGAPGGNSAFNGAANTESIAGIGGSSSIGGGGVAVGGSTGAAANGTNGAANTGGGGGGAYAFNGTAKTGGVGGSGLVIITEYCSQ